MIFRWSKWVKFSKGNFRWSILKRDSRFYIADMI